MQSPDLFGIQENRFPLLICFALQPMKPVYLTLPEARAVVLRAGGLGEDPAPFGLGQQGAARAVEQLGYVQIDTISVVERAHHHVLWSRVPDYTPDQLDALQAERLIFEYWSHARAYLPMVHHRFSRPLMQSFRKGTLHWSDASPELDAAMRRVLRQVRSDGPVMAREFESEVKGKAGDWGFSKIEKRALHELWIRGQVMVSGRRGFQKLYDLPERVLPADLEARLPRLGEFARHHILQSLRSLGIARLPELHYLIQEPRRSAIIAAIPALLKEGLIQTVTINDAASSQPAYALPAALEMRSPFQTNVLRILSPFDNVVIQRERLRWLFGYDYLIECYVPAAKRRYGYFCLPVLWGDRFVARIDAKAERSESTLVVKSVHWEAGCKTRDAKAALNQALQDFARFNRCQNLRFPPA